MSFVSIDYLLFFPVVVLMYFVIPRRLRMYWLLATSYYFYMSWNAQYGALLLFSTVITYLIGIVVEKARRQKKVILLAGVIVNLGLLVYFKYSYFLLETVNAVFQMGGRSISAGSFDIVLPVGISFFIFQSLGYTIDVYRGEIEAERNFFRYALFVSFFPQLVAGPIERSKNLLKQLHIDSVFDAENARYGLLTIAWGIFMKIVAADNIAAVIDPVFDSPGNYSGMTQMFAVILFAFQIYCDFNGYTQIAIGSARVLGYRLNENFNAPYLACSVKDFWRRWHISLTSWFRDYLYIPLGGSRRGKIRKLINNMIVFLLSGLWHGAGWHFVVWGGVNGLFSSLEDCLEPVKRVILDGLSVDTSRFAYKVFQRIVTFILIDFGWLFFRAKNMRTALDMLTMICKDFHLVWFMNFGFVDLFDSTESLMIILASLTIIIIADVLKYKEADFMMVIFGQQTLFRWVIYSGLMLLILYWGLFGMDYEQTQFIYFQF